MSGQRNKKPSDVIKSRQEYLDNLSLEVQLNDANEQAVRQFKETGQVPPISQMKDTRTTSQILADVEKLKINLIKDLEPIADPQFAQQIIQRLIQSPLNQDNRLLIFTAQRIDDIVKNLKKIYKYGIKGDVNDAEGFVLFINKFYTDKNKTIEGTKSFINRMGSSGESGAASRLTVQHNTLSTLASEFKIFMDRRNVILGVLVAVGLVINPDDLQLSQILLNDISIKLRALLQILPVSLTTIQNMEQISIQNIGTAGYNAAADSYSEFLDFINHNIPNTDYIQTIMDDLRNSNTSISNQLGYNPTQAGFDKVYKNQINILQKLNDVLDVDLPTLTQLERLSAVARAKIAEQPYKPETMSRAAMTPQEIAIHQDLTDRIDDNLAQMRDPANIAIPRIGLPAGHANVPVNVDEPAFAARLANIAPIGAPRDSVNIPKLEQLQKDTFNHLKKYGIVGRGINTRTSIDGSRNPTSSSKESFGQGFSLWDTPKSINPVDYMMPRDKIKYRMVGKGLPRADYTQGIDPSPRYIKFGRYMINNKKLNDNVLSLRRSRGSTIATIPATKMTSELGGVIKKIVGGGVPSFDELNALTDAEKRYLFRVSQEADIYDKIKIPTPSKDEEEKDIHAFNVMKGEILAGNNSKELVAKFKALLNKLSKNNILPKSQVREILEELLELGY